MNAPLLFLLLLRIRIFPKSLNFRWIAELALSLQKRTLT